MDRVHRVAHGSPAGPGTGNAYGFNVFQKLVNIPLFYTGITGNISELAAESVGAVLYSFNGSATTKFDANVRLGFKDA